MTFSGAKPAGSCSSSFFALSVLCEMVRVWQTDLVIELGGASFVCFFPSFIS